MSGATTNSALPEQYNVFEKLLSSGAKKNIPLTHDGFPARQNPDGSISTELSITVTDPRLNNGKPTNIPSLWQGEEVDEDTAVLNAVHSGKRYRAFKTIQEAVEAARQRSERGGASVPTR